MTAEQREPPRKKLSPKMPSKKIKKCKTFIGYNRRDCELTAHQQSWARSLAVSLSGWRTRQNFLKAQLEAHLKTETEHAAEEAILQAALQAQEDERRAQIVKPQAEADAQFARDAATYQRRASEVHQANMENKIDEELDDEEYMHNYITKLRRYGSFAKRKEVKNDGNDKRGKSDTGIPYVLSPDIVSPEKMHPTPVAPPAANVDWRIKAQSGIAKKKLTIDKGWSAVTWNQKSNVHERLLLLEGDGYDITELQDRKISSEEITAIILERAAAQQQPDNTSTPPVRKPEEVELVPASSPVTPQSVVDKSTLSPAASPDYLSITNDQLPTETSPTSLHENISAPTQQSATLPIVEDDTQPFYFNEPYQPRASPRLKRKRDCHSDVQDLEDGATAGYPALKKRNIVFHTDDALRLQALQEMKRKVFRLVFRPTRSICQEPSPISRVVFSADALRSNRQEQTKFTPTLDYLYAKRAVAISLDESLSIPVVGYDNMMAELRFLTNTSSATETSMTITDPDYDDEELISTAVVQSEAGNKGSHVLGKRKDFNRGKSRIVISKDQQNRQVFQGDTLTLAELFKVLQQRELFHHVDWEWAGLRLILSSNLLWSLGPETQDTLLEIELRLRQYVETGAAEICVRRVDDGRAGHP